MWVSALWALRIAVCLIAHVLHCTCRELPLIARSFANQMLISENKTSKEKIRRREIERRGRKEKGSKKGGKKEKRKGKWIFKNKFTQLLNVIYRTIDMDIVAPLVSWLNACWPVCVYFISGWELLGPVNSVYSELCALTTQ